MSCLTLVVSQVRNTRMFQLENQDWVEMVESFEAMNFSVQIPQQRWPTAADVCPSAARYVPEGPREKNKLGSFLAIG